MSTASASTLKKRIPSHIFKQNSSLHRVDSSYQYDEHWSQSRLSDEPLLEDGEDGVDANASTTSIVSRIIRLVFWPLQEAYFVASWLIWLLMWLPLAGGSGVLALWLCLRIAVSIVLYMTVLVIRKFNSAIVDVYWHLACFAHRRNRASIPWVRHHLVQASSWEEWRHYASKLDRLESNEQWKRQQQSDLYDHKLLNIQLSNLTRYRQTHDIKSLIFTLSHIFSRQYCNINNERLYLQCHLGTKYMIEEFYARIVEQLAYITRTELADIGVKEKLQFFQRARKSYGKTALCLSGGGALALYHTGVSRALLFANCLPDIINGTSGGAIIAGVLATRTDAELRAPGFLTPDIANRFGVAWLPSLPRQARHFVRHGVLMDWREFANTARTYYGDMTFEEGFRRTRRHVSITVSYSTARSMSQGHAMVCNHVTTPHVLIWSAVTASCSLPGLMQPQTLFAKTYDNEIVPYYPKGVEYVDGSLYADIPVQRLTELFNAQVFVVSQVNPHVQHFIRPSARIFGSEGAAGENSFSLLAALEKHLANDVSHHLSRLAKLKVIPKIYGQDFRPVWNGTQRYTGDITIAPEISYRMQLKVICQPTNADMVEFIRSGEQATWPVISRIQNAMIVERTLDECVKQLAKQLRHSHPYRQQHIQRKASFQSVTSPTIERGRFDKKTLPGHQTTNMSTVNNKILLPTTATRSRSDSGIASSIEPIDKSGPHQSKSPMHGSLTNAATAGTASTTDIAQLNDLTTSSDAASTDDLHTTPPQKTSRTTGGEQIEHSDDDVPDVSVYVDNSLSRDASASSSGRNTLRPARGGSHSPPLSHTIATRSRSSSITQALITRPAQIMVNALAHLDHQPANLPNEHTRTPSASGKFWMPTRAESHGSSSDDDDDDEILMEIEELQYSPSATATNSGRPSYSYHSASAPHIARASSSSNAATSPPPCNMRSPVPTSPNPDAATGSATQSRPLVPAVPSRRS